MMAVSGYVAGFLILAIVLVRFLRRWTGNDAIPINWPLLGMHPTILVNFHRLHDTLTDMLQASRGTIKYKGLWFANEDFWATSDPDNVRYILSKDNSVYLKGSVWMKQFDIFGDQTLFNTDGDVWRRHRKSYHTFLNHPKFHQLVAKLIPECVEQGLVKVLEHVSDRGMVVDLQDLFARHSSDIAGFMSTGNHPRLLSVEFPKNRFHDAMIDAWEASFYRYLVPQPLWKLQSWLGIGKEKKRSNAWKVLEHLSSDFLATQRERISKAREANELVDNIDHDGLEGFNFLNFYLNEHESDEAIKENLINFMFAATDSNSTTLTWFFYLLSKNPSVVAKIREELKANLSFKQVGKVLLPSSMNVEQSKLVYLHAALSETLRLFPPVPFEFRTCNQRDVLPSGHCINKNMRVVISMYAMGRMSWIWGEDCNEFKPERWITEEGKIKREPPSKFPAFFAGPRICLGKDLGFTIMKSTAAAILHNYDVHVLQGQNARPRNSVFFQMKNGLKVTIKNRSSP